MKKIERFARFMSLLQLTVINNAIVYDLQPDNRIEVAMLENMESWSDPVKFSATGFDYIAKNKTMVVNAEQTLGFSQLSSN